ncbi:LOW QUALITY PROTEIN: L-type lectin-domain containing receptor kinase IX.1-like [Pyrus x bretschneideri]|uniref:LOW QUALITY PROTEIN: L-type lectin-domain containing receptor kinase IX.1-like n=1 Tax=Pyrus x bretschneideri TaxID=225117 RepID=UPI00203068E2|nr:LOW QUALITY PROTEIN: L-type lectin-domain containing receptor kinase IX.1-like [Pyrus x bretschneideri]
MPVICSSQVTFCVFFFINFVSPFAHSKLASPLSFTISQFNNDNKNIIYEGDATPSLGMVELNTMTQYFRAGRCTYAQPLHLWDYATGSMVDFSTYFTFMIDTRKTTQYMSDGLAFFLAPVGYPIPPNGAGGGLGLFNTTTQYGVPQNQIVMVEFDTYSNTEWDPPGQHVGINVNKISSAITRIWEFGNKTRKNTHVSITYNAVTKNLSVSWTYDEDPSSASFANTSFSFPIDLSEVLPEQVTIGFSAATGLYPERHVINSWEFTSSMHYGRRIQNQGRKRLIIFVAVSAFVVMLGVAMCVWLVVLIRKNRNSSFNVTTPLNVDLERLAFPKRFTYKELVAVTNGFGNDRRLGHGGSGQVYKGMLQDLGCTVAVKRIFAESEHYEKVFINEVKIISRLIHRNLVQFIGWCHEQGECLLVYAYMPNSSLDQHLFGCRATLQWDFRYKIALGLASALNYLHEDVEQCVLHRDIKSANVLLDTDFSSKLGDFGIAKLVDPRFRTQTTGVVGTYGYMAPEYASGGRASKESDMFSFGVVALEIACGRRTYQDGELHVPLVRWVWQLYLAGNLLYAADERLDKKFDEKEMECLLMVGLWCTNPSNKGRPKAGQVMKVLLFEAPLLELPYDRRWYDDPLPQGNDLSP